MPLCVRKHSQREAKGWIGTPRVSLYSRTEGRECGIKFDSSTCEQDFSLKRRKTKYGTESFQSRRRWHRSDCLLKRLTCCRKGRFQLCSFLVRTRCMLFQPLAHDRQLCHQTALVRFPPICGDRAAHQIVTCGDAYCPDAFTASGLSAPSTCTRTR